MLRYQLFFYPISLLLVINLLSCDINGNELDSSPDDTTDVDSISEDSSGFALCIDSLIQNYNYGCLRQSILLIHPLIRVGDTIITIEINPDILDITTTCQTFPYNEAGINIVMQSTTISRDSVYFNLCGDIIFEVNPPDTLLPLSGSITIVSDTTVLSSSEGYRISLQTSDLIFANSSKPNKVTFYKQAIRRWP
jgi:hypothetical protein